MIVDDSVFMRNMLCTMLGMKGFKVVAEAADGDEAVERYLALRPQLTFMDVLVPQKSGRDATKEIISLDGNAKQLCAVHLAMKNLLKQRLNLEPKMPFLSPIKTISYKRFSRE